MKKKILRIISLALCITVIMCILTSCGSESTKVPEQISLNGLKFGSLKDKMIECLGEPTYWVGRSETSAVYEFTDGGRMHIDIVLNQVFDIDIYGLC